MKTLLTLLILAFTNLAHATDNSYGYLVFWQNPSQPEIITVTKTTQENATQTEAQAEMALFCKEQNQRLNTTNKISTGCLSITALHNTCVAAAWPSKQGLLKHTNVIIYKNKNFHKVAQLALNQCHKKYGQDAVCAIETVFCTSQAAYEI